MTEIATRMAQIAPFYVMDLLARARQMEAQGRSIIHMEIGEPDYNTPEPVSAAGQAALVEGKIHYTPATGLPELRQEIALFYQQHYQVDVDPDRVIVTPGSSGALQLLMSVLINPAILSLWLTPAILVTAIL